MCSVAPFLYYKVHLTEYHVVNKLSSGAKHPLVYHLCVC